MSKKIISNLFNYATRAGAKDLIIENWPEKISVNCLFPDGRENSFTLPAKLEKELGSTLRQVLKLAPDDLITRRYCQLENRAYHLSFYLTIIPGRTGERIVINIVSKEEKPLRLNQLGLQNNNLKTLKTALKKKSGLIIVSSPNNQGKSTTLSSLLRELNDSARSLYFLGGGFGRREDNIIYFPEAEDNWDKAIHLDSDIIATEITSEDKLKDAIYAAATGRLVLITLKADSVWEIMSAILRIKLPLKLKLDCLKLIINQRVVPLGRAITDQKKKNNRKNIGIFETLELYPDLKDFILAAKNDKKKENFWEKLGRLALVNGYQPLSADKNKKIKNGLI